MTSPGRTTVNACANRRSSLELCNFEAWNDVFDRENVNLRLKQVRHFRDGKWTESVAVGSRAFVTETKERLGIRAIGRKMVETGDNFELRESPTPYKVISGYENAAIRFQNE
jgi:putative transposase